MATGVCREGIARGRYTLSVGVVQMASTDDPRPSPRDRAQDATTGAAEVLAYTELTQEQALNPPGAQSGLFAQWARGKRHRALRPRYGEDLGYGEDDEDDFSPWMC